MDQEHWLLKTEPGCWSWENQAANSGLSVWDGVRNMQAQNLMKVMSKGDLCFFYHTGKLKEVVGIVRVVKTFYPDPTDDSGKWGAVDVQEVREFKCPVTLAQMRQDEHFKDFLMLRQPRLSVVPVKKSIWERVCELGDMEEAKPTSKNGSRVKDRLGTENIEEEGIFTGKKRAKSLNTVDAETEKRVVPMTKNGTHMKREAKKKKGEAQVDEHIIAEEGARKKLPSGDRSGTGRGAERTQEASKRSKRL